MASSSNVTRLSTTTEENQLIPVIIDNAGKVTKANINEKWYSYVDKEWANAVILKDYSISYEDYQEIPESNIESYFVWIPKYSYQLWDLGSYDSLTSIESKERIINIRFGFDNTSDSVTGECTTSGVAGSSGNCKVIDDIGDYMTHPAFLAFDTNGFWVGKFETGFEGVTGPSMEMNIYDLSKVIIKPNVYSWSCNTLGNIFKVSYEYLREYDSHMMKNTEWGAVAYLQHSAYGSATSLRINNNKDYITGYSGTIEPTIGYNNQTSIDGNKNESTQPGADGEYTVNYFNNSSVISSTTGNYTGIYDMSGGAWEYVMGYTTEATTVGGSSEITNLYNTFFTDSNYEKYYDKYTSIAVANYNNRILGDATGEIGPFGKDSVNQSSWYKDYPLFVASPYPWFVRGGSWGYGSSAGNFAFSASTGAIDADASFRIILVPTK